MDTALEKSIVELLRAMPRDASICPGDAARAVDPNAWSDLLGPALDAARRLAVQGLVEITYQGRVVDPTAAGGPVRVRLTHQ